jgi:hypothetical protein
MIVNPDTQHNRDQAKHSGYLRFQSSALRYSHNGQPALRLAHVSEGKEGDHRLRFCQVWSSDALSLAG